VKRLDICESLLVLVRMCKHRERYELTVGQLVRDADEVERLGGGDRCIVGDG
jgi:hypothetical protein